MTESDGASRIAPGWSGVRRRYTCRDGKRAEVQRGTTEHGAPRNLVKYARYKHRRFRPSIVVSGTQFCRDMAEILGNSDTSRTITFPETVRTAQRYVLNKTRCLRSVVLNECLLVLGDDSHDKIGNGNNLERLVLSRTLERIEGFEFTFCGYLKRICVDDGCAADLPKAWVLPQIAIGPRLETMVGCLHVWDLRGLKDVVVPEGTEQIGNCWFWDCEVRTVEIPASARAIGTFAFHGCKYLERLTFWGTTVDTAKKHSRNTHLSEKSLLKVIEKSAFRYCASLRNVELPNGLEDIGPWAFADSGLESIATPPSVRTIHQGAFYKCQRLRKAVLNEGLEVLGTDEYPESSECGVFQDSALKSVKLPSTLRRIEHCAFADCADLKSVVLSDGVEYIGRAAFARSGLQSFTRPASLRTICQDTFSECRNIRTVVLGPKAPNRNAKPPVRKIESGAF